MAWSKGARVAGVVAVSLAILALPAVGRAGVYAGNKCVSAKMKVAGQYCQKSFDAWSKWETKQDAGECDAALLAARTALSEKWGKAEESAAKKQVDCADTTELSSEAQASVDDTVGDIVALVNGGLDLGDSDQAKCGAKLLKAVGKKCAAFLKAESKYIKKLDKDPVGTARDAAQSDASTALSTAWGDIITAGCPTTASESTVEAQVDALSDAIVLKTTFSPNVDDSQFTTISPTGPIEYLKYELNPTCIGSTPYHFFVKRGSVNKLLMYYQGGGACWEQVTCGVPVCDSTVVVDPNSTGTDNPNAWSDGFADLANPANPFKDWNIVMVSYCSCDVHFGDTAQDYDNDDPDNPRHIEHRGFQNAKAAEKWAREHFVNPEVVFVTGSSAGAYGAIFQAPLLHKVWPASQFHVLGDAGNGVITSSFLQNEFNNWNFKANLPKDIPGVIEAIDSGNGMPAYVEAVAAYFPNTNWAHYTTAYDGGSGGQTGFYNLMLHDNNPLAALTWWEGSCAFNTQMHLQATNTATAVLAKHNNYRYYIGTGSRHTMWGSDKVYGDTTGGVPTVVAWINAMLTNGLGWVNVEASPFNVLLSGDPKPSPLEDPFEGSDPNVIVNCP
jgi:hypothetical protein